MKTRFLLATVSFIALHASNTSAFAQTPNTPDMFADVAATYGLTSDQLSQATKNAIDDVRSVYAPKLPDAQQAVDDAQKMVALKSPGAADALKAATDRLTSLDNTYNATVAKISSLVAADVNAAQNTPSFAITRTATFTTNQAYVDAAKAVNDIGGGSLVVAAENLVAAGGGNLTVAQRAELGRLVAAGGGNLVAAGGGNLVAAGGGNLDAVSKSEIALLVAAGGGNVSADTMAKVSTLVAAGGGNLVASGGGNLVAAGGGNLVAAGGGNLVAAGGGNILNFDAKQTTALVAAGGGNVVDVVAAAKLITNDGGSIMRAATSLVAAGGGNLSVAQLAEVNRLVAAGGGNLVAAGGGNLTVMDKAALATLVAAGGGNLVAAGGGNVIATDAMKLVAAGGGNLGASTRAALTIADPKQLTNIGNIVSTNGGVLLAQGGAISMAQVANISSLQSATGAIQVSGMRSLMMVDGPMAPARTSAQVAAMTALNTAASNWTNASTAALNATIKYNDLQTQLAVATKAKDQQAINLINTELPTAKADLDKANVAISAAQKAATAAALINVPLVAATDVAAVNLLTKTTSTKLQNDSVAVDKSNNDFKTATAPAGPSTLQNAATAAAAQAQTAATVAATSDAAVQALTKTLGTSHPTDLAAITQLAKTENTAGINTATKQLSDAQSELAKLKASPTSNPAAIAAQQDQVNKAQSNLNFVNASVANNQNLKVSLATAAATDLTNAKAVVDGLTKAYGSNRPTDPQQNATITAAMVVQALAQDKADQTAADAAAANLIIRGGSKNDIQVQQDLSAAKQKDMAGILKVNPQVLAAAGVSGSTDPALVTKAINGLVSAAAKQTSAAVQQTTAAVQTANAALQQAQAAPAPAPAVSTTTSAAATTAAAIASFNNTVAALSASKSVAAAPNLPGSAVAPTSTNPAATSSSQNPTGGGAPPAVTVPAAIAQVANAPATAASAVPTPAAPAAADISGLSPAMVQQLVTSGPAVILGLQAQQAAAAAKGDPASQAIAAALGRDIVSVQGQIDAAKKVAAATPAAVTAAVAAPTAAAATPASNATAAATPASTPAAVANASPTATVPASAAAAPAAAATTAGPATPAVSVPGPDAATSKSVDAPAPVKLTPDQSKAIQKALTTIPGNLSKADEAMFSKLSTLVTLAAGKGLVTSEDAAALTNGLKALADKHPKAEKQIGLTALAKAVAPTPKSTVAITTPAATPVAVASPTNATAITAKPLEPKSGEASEHAVPKSEITSKTPSNAPAITAEPVEPKSDKAAVPALPKPAVASTTPSATVKPTPAKPSPSEVMRSAPKPSTPTTPKVQQVSAPKPAIAAVQNKPAAAPKAPNCTPNMQNGKMMGMICH